MLTLRDTDLLIRNSLHWYLAVIVNPRWIIDAATDEDPLPIEKTERAPATRGRTSTAASTNDNSVTLSSSSQPGSPAAVSNQESTAEITSRHFSGKKKNGDIVVSTPSNSNSNAGEEDDVEMEFEEGEKSEEQIQAKLREEVAKTEMGGEEEGEEDELDEDGGEGDVTMNDASVEGGGPSNDQGDTLILSDDENDQVTPESIEQRVSSTSTTAQASTSTRTPVPIGAPTAPPKGASSPPKQPTPPLAEAMDVDEELSAVDLARELGADESQADRYVSLFFCFHFEREISTDPVIGFRRCWIFTFDSLGGKHDAVVEKLRRYLDMEAKTKKFKKWTAADQVQGITVKVSPLFFSPALVAD